MQVHPIVAQTLRLGQEQGDIMHEILQWSINFAANSNFPPSPQTEQTFGITRQGIVFNLRMFGWRR
jgi:hypothetical protein